MSGKISQYTNEATVIGDNDWFDISVEISPGNFESQKIKGSTVKTLIGDGVNIYTSNGVQTDPTRTYNGSNGVLIFNKLNEFNVDANEVNISAETNIDGLVNLKEAIYETGIQNTSTNIVNVVDEASVVMTDSTLNNINLLLPSAPLFPGRKITVIDVSGTSSTNSVTILPDGTETINNSPALELNLNYSWVILRSDGSNWVAQTSKTLKNLGSASYEDTTTTLGTVANTPIQLPIAKDIVIEDQLPAGITTYWNDTINAIPGRYGDDLAIQINLKAESTMPDQWLDIWCDFGTGTQQYRQTFTFPKGSGVVRNILYCLPAIYTRSSFVTNGLKFYLESNGIVEITNPKLNITLVNTQ